MSVKSIINKVFSKKETLVQDTYDEHIKAHIAATSTLPISNGGGGLVITHPQYNTTLSGLQYSVNQQQAQIAQNQQNMGQNIFYNVNNSSYGQYVNQNPSGINAWILEQQEKEKISQEEIDKLDDITKAILKDIKPFFITNNSFISYNNTANILDVGKKIAVHIKNLKFESKLEDIIND